MQVNPLARMATLSEKVTCPADEKVVPLDLLNKKNASETGQEKGDCSLLAGP